MRQRSTAARRQAWARAYITTLIERDIQDAAQILDAGLQSTLSRLTPEPWFLSHYSDKDQRKVDFVFESASRELIGIEVKAAASVQASDFKGLRRLREVAGKPFVTGIVLYDGQQALSFGDGSWAVPLDQL
jgi:predicted AAA+ superfamily ATPase